jgi:surface antigen
MAAMLAGALLSGCGAPARKQDMGAAVGAIGGAAVGSQVGGGTGRIAAVIAGAVAGGVLGGKYGRYLDEQDRQNVTRATERSLATDAPQGYTSPSGAKVTVMPRGSSSYENARQIMVSPEVDTNYPLRADRRIVFAMTDMDLRSAPRLTSKTTRLLQRGERAEVVAFVPNSQYRLVSINGTAIGYAREVYLAQRKEDVPPPRHASVNAVGRRPVKSNVSPAHAARARRVALKGECKLVKGTIQLPNGTAETETVKFCKEPPSVWKEVS